MFRFETGIRIPSSRNRLFRIGTGPELLVIHGGPDWDHSYIRTFMDPLAAERTLIFFDLRGCGRSQRFTDPEALHVSRVVEDTQGLLSHYGLGSVDVIGFSFGGRVALELVRRAPHAVRRLILASSSAYPQPSRSVPPRLTPEELRDHALASASEDVQSSEACARFQRAIGEVRFSNQWLRAFHSGREFSDSRRDYSSDLRRSSIPILVLHGERDGQFPIASARRLTQEVPSARLVELPGAGHMAHIDVPAEWNAAISAFLKQRSTNPTR